MRQKVFALVDCNSFYVSCQKAFDASLQKSGVIVLSNNDGCVVALSNDVKQLGVKRGQPFFQCQDIILKHHIRIFSSNYSLYADMSRRVISVLAGFCPHVEVYSIDEAFLELTDLTLDDLTEFGREVKARIWQFTGIPVSVGIAATKTLSKIATEIVKQDPSYEGVLDLTCLTEEEINRLLEKVAIKDVWGIGRKYALFLENYGIQTAKHLKDADEKWIRKHLTVVGERTVVELRGTSCIPLETEPKPKQAIMCAKTFGREVTSREELAEIIATYTARCAEKLRAQESLTTSIGIFIQTNRFDTKSEHYHNSFSIRLPHPTAFTPTLIHSAQEGLRAIYRDGYKYKKAGVYLAKVVSEDSLQPDLFGEFSLYQYYRQMRLMAIVDAINRIYGRDTLFFGSQGISRTWKMRQFRLSPRYTTRWEELLSVTTE